MYRIIYTYPLPVQLHSRVWTFTKPLHLLLSFHISSSVTVCHWTPLFSISCLTSSIHLLRGLPRSRLPFIVISSIFRGILSSSILLTCPYHLNLVFSTLTLKLSSTIPLLKSSFLILSRLDFLFTALINFISPA